METAEIPSETDPIEPSTEEVINEQDSSETLDDSHEKAALEPKVNDQPSLPFHLSLPAVAPWKSLTLIALALVFGWADWRFAQTWRVPAEVKRQVTSTVKLVTINSPCYQFSVRASVLDSSPKDSCDRQFQFGGERIARLRVSAIRGNEKPISAEEIPHSPTEKPLRSDITINGVKAAQTTYVDMGHRYINITISKLPKKYSDKIGVVNGLQLTAPYGDSYAEKTTIDGILRDWKWR